MKFSTLAAILSTTVIGAWAETHTVHFNNRCGFGTPMLIQGPNVLSRGGDFTSNGPFRAAIAYLQNGNCGFNGDGCTLVELTLVNPTSPGSGSSADISLIPPLKFSQAASFNYNKCGNIGASCPDANCPKAFRKPDDNFAQVACQENDAGLTITFC
ncbi:hypothetical protein AGABI2DRAFT_192200 [Agaricus bisporus var. bisporus H97]|uniref:hypothetical protein n=1 Tax=Agaricus bisporus var. bisporus (strain H97 / ATCC MYA-4626 / FGSC 10389) TaxID=936046 RepID=UPI00029F6101|nr:hypothetical protein AGABI2DRAFT_192200 [Agaricus bisporus var. bisporus H97]EKV48664.1 hypothetical protein AGABI2DRAFT_192200 [Agaricus bisporus var. bisporus H97]